MWNHSPQLEYRGLTIVMSNASRFDKSMLLSGNGGVWFTNEVLRPGLTRYHCHIMDLEAYHARSQKLLAGTRVVMCLGAKAQREVMLVDTTLNQQRGSPVVRDGVVYISSYLPQDALDPVNWEARLNPELQDEGESKDNYEESEGDEKSRHGATNRSNYRFWLMRDTAKVKRILQEGLTKHEEPKYIIYPSAQEAEEFLRSYKDTTLHMDIETDCDRNMYCVGVSFTDKPSEPVFVIPIIRYNYVPAYSCCGRLLRALGIATSRNQVVAHNGAGFDFLVFASKYRLPFSRKLIDTMIMHHRCFPEVEKSLGHCISNFTDLPYHKDEGIFQPKTEQHEQQLWTYNAKDVFSMREVKRGIDAYARTVPGLTESIQQANDSIYPYLLTTLQGIRYNEDEAAALVALNDRKMTQLLRAIRVAMGPSIAKFVRGSGKDGFPASNPQCVRYFHEVCKYPVVGYGKAGKTGKKKPSLDEKNFYKLVMKQHDNPIIDLVLKYRELQKESSAMIFNPWPGVEK